VHTFLPLVTLCTDPRALSALAADFLGAAIARPAPAEFYDKLALACVAADRLHDAFRLVAMLVKLRPARTWDEAARAWAVDDADWWMRTRCVVPLATRAVEVGDARGWELVERLEKSRDQSVREQGATIRRADSQKPKPAP
jgi:hypothetical protein